jgi:DNA-binding NarL/FixJ family response regulator
MKINDQNMLIIRLMGDGKTDKEISDQMKMNLDTVKMRVRNMLKKWDCKNRTQLVLKVVMFNIESFASK